MGSITLPRRSHIRRWEGEDPSNYGILRYAPNVPAYRRLTLDSFYVARNTFTTLYKYGLRLDGDRGDRWYAEEKGWRLAALEVVVMHLSTEWGGRLLLDPEAVTKVTELLGYDPSDFFSRPRALQVRSQEDGSQRLLRFPKPERWLDDHSYRNYR